MVDTFLQAKFEVRSWLAREPLLAPAHQLIVWWTQWKVRPYIDVRECRVDRTTEFVLDGFQGSGNSFATVAFKHSQQRPVRLAHHLHAPAQIIKAVEYGLPTLITLRDPTGAVISLTSRWPYITVAQALRSYVRFYEKIEPYADGCILSPFEYTTRKLDVVIAAVNRRYDCSFDLFDGSEAAVRVIRDPSKLREEAKRRQPIKDEKRRQLHSSSLTPLRERAEALHERLASRSQEWLRAPSVIDTT